MSDSLRAQTFSFTGTEARDLFQSNLNLWFIFRFGSWEIYVEDTWAIFCWKRQRNCRSWQHKTASVSSALRFSLPLFYSLRRIRLKLSKILKITWTKPRFCFISFSKFLGSNTIKPRTNEQFCVAEVDNYAAISICNLYHSLSKRKLIVCCYNDSTTYSLQLAISHLLNND